MFPKVDVLREQLLSLFCVCLRNQPTLNDLPLHSVQVSVQLNTVCFPGPVKHGCLNSIWHDRIPDERLPSNTSPGAWGIPICASAVTVSAVFFFFYISGPRTRGLSTHFKLEVISHSVQVRGWHLNTYYILFCYFILQCLQYALCYFIFFVNLLIDLFSFSSLLMFLFLIVPRPITPCVLVAVQPCLKWYRFKNNCNECFLYTSRCQQTRLTLGWRFKSRLAFWYRLS